VPTIKDGKNGFRKNVETEVCGNCNYLSPIILEGGIRWCFENSIPEGYKFRRGEQWIHTCDKFIRPGDARERH
jgi:hypothetical protein